MSEKKQKAARVAKCMCGQIFNKLTLRYFLYGLVAVAIKIISFEILVYLCRLEEVTANAIAWVIFTAFSYFTCRKYVFKSECHGAKKVAGESSKFILFKVLSLLLEEGLMVLFAYLLLKGHPTISQVIVVTVSSIFNYTVNRLLVFKKKWYEPE